VEEVVVVDGGEGGWRKGVEEVVVVDEGEGGRG
jgi:hypothetical protein